MDPQWRLQIGEILFNLRSCLDHLAWQLVILDGGKPGEYTQFPIRETPFSKAGNLTATQIVPDIKCAQILEALEEVQPYYGPGRTPTRIPKVRCGKSTSSTTSTSTGCCS